MLLSTIQRYGPADKIPRDLEFRFRRMLIGRRDHNAKLQEPGGSRVGISNFSAKRTKQTNLVIRTIRRAAVTRIRLDSEPTRPDRIRQFAAHWRRVLIRRGKTEDRRERAGRDEANVLWIGKCLCDALPLVER